MISREILILYQNRRKWYGKFKRKNTYDYSSSCSNSNLCSNIVLFENYESAYFTQIDNTKIEKLSSTDDMKYKYTLECYNEKGKKKELKFKTSRELKEDAFLKLEVKTLGVHSWEEVQYDELPKKVQTNYTK